MNSFRRIPLILSALAAVLTLGVGTAQAGPGVGTYYANSPAGGMSGTPLRKFVDGLPGLGPTQKNNLGQYIPIAMPIANPAFPADDYYEIGIVEYTERMHSDLPKATRLRGYRDLNPAADPQAHYLGPLIIAQKNKPVRIKYTNMLPVGPAGNLFIPVDKTVMGAGTGPLGGVEEYTQNRTAIHLHGGLVPWISDGTPHQWITPAAETTNYDTGVSQQNVPDMPNPGAGSATLYYTNAQSARLMFYHDHAYGITRLNVYAGIAAGYLITDTVEQGLVTAGKIPSAQVPLVIQDKTFVPNDVAVQDSKWDAAAWGQPGDLWFPHVYEPNQDPTTADGTNPMGRWDYGPWFWPIFPAPSPLPEVSQTPESFMDTPVVNGTAYPYLNVDRKAYRFRILNAANDRFWNLQLYYVDPADPLGTEVKMVPAVPHPPTDLTWPATWPVDGRAGGVPDPTLVGPEMIQIGNEGGLLPAPVVIPNHPVGYEYFRRSITVLNIQEHALLLGPAERADVIIDFSQVPAGSKIILYNDCPAPVPAFDARIDYYTGDPDQTDIGGAPSTLPGYGPNTRTIMQFRVSSAPASAAFDLAGLQAALPVAYGQSQEKPVVAESAYGAPFGKTFADKYANIFTGSANYPTFDYVDGNGKPASLTIKNKAIIEEFDMEYGRMSSMLGSEQPFTNALNQTSIPYLYTDPPNEFMTAGEPQIWKITHNGVDTHSVHFHLFDVQLINRIGWDGTVKPPDANELGWKESVRMNPLEDIVIAMKPKAPPVPFAVPTSLRPMAPNLPIGAQLPLPAAVPPILNDMFDFGWEYVWHCHLLGHEEYDMMRPVVFSVPSAVPADPTLLGAVAGTAAITLSWTDNATNETGYRVERAIGAGAFALLVNISADSTGYVDASALPGKTYNYRVFAFNLIGDSAASNIAPAGPIVNAVPANVSATAVNGYTGVGQPLLGRWSDGNGAGDINIAYIQIGSTASGLVKLRYARSTNQVSMMNDAGTAWLPGFAPGSANVIANTRVSLDCAGTAVTANGNTLTVNFRVTPLAGYVGTKALAIYATDKANASTPAWSAMGSWKIASAINVPPVNESASAANGNTGIAQMVTGVWSDANGSLDVNNVQMQIGVASTGGLVKLKYVQATNQLYILNDTNTAWLGGGTVGSVGSISNSRATLNYATSTVSSVGNILTVNFNVTPLAGWTGSKALRLYAYDTKNAVTPAWTLLGTWTIAP